MQRCERPCEAPTHSAGCPCAGCYQRKVDCRKTTDDHFTPQCIEKIAQIKDTKENHQWLSVPCHRDKDMDTPMRADVLRLEKKGIIFTWEQHREIFETGVSPRVMAKRPERVTEPVHEFIVLPGENFQRLNNSEN